MTEPASPTPTNPSASLAASPSPSPAAAAPADASNLTPTPAARPEYVPETFWDATTNSVKPEFTAHYTELTTAKAALDARIAARPEKAEGYELKFPEGFTPEVPVAIDETDPRVAEIRAFAHELNLSQGEFSKLLTVEAQHRITEKKKFNEQKAAETAKLGANGTMRVTALKARLVPIIGAERFDAWFGSEKNEYAQLPLADDVAAFEKIGLAMSNGGASTYNNGGREPPALPPKSPAERIWPNGFNPTPQAKAS